MRILFVHPNFDAPLGVSIGVSYIAGTLRREGHEVGAIHVSEILDYPFELERVVEDVRGFDPDLLAITCGYNHYAEMRQVIAAVGPKIPVLLGGVHSTLNTPQVVEENPDHTILRSSWFFGPWPPDRYPEVFLEALGSGKPIRIVADRIGSPTYLRDLARALAILIDVPPADVVHFCTRRALAHQI